MQERVRKPKARKVTAFVTDSDNLEALLDANTALIIASVEIPLRSKVMRDPATLRLILEPAYKQLALALRDCAGLDVDSSQLYNMSIDCRTYIGYLVVNVYANTGPEPKDQLCFNIHILPKDGLNLFMRHRGEEPWKL